MLLDALTRRGFLGNAFTALGGIGLADLVSRDAAANAPATHHAPRARRVLQIFCPGAASHVDLWDHKPALERYDGQPMPGEERLVSFQGANGGLMKSPWPFLRAGRCGKPINSLMPFMARHVDDIAFIHSMTSRTNTHGPGCIFINTGQVMEGFPAAGAWVSHALGSLNDALPTYVAIPDVRGEPPNGKANWSNGFLPARHQGVLMSAQQPIRNLTPPANADPAQLRAARSFLDFLNERDLAAHPGNSELQARMAAYSLAGRMQLSAPEAVDLARESAVVHRLYGADDANPLKAAYARNCLLARRLLERGVRYVNLYCASRASGTDGALNWDAHKTLFADYNRHLPIFDQPTAALLTDLKQSGLLEDTIVLWTTEFGRMPTQQANTPGRDHNPDAFTVWLMGAGIRGGVSHGATDDFGRRSIDNVTTIWDVYATILHLLGFDHTRLTWRHNGLDRRLTDVHGELIQPILI